MKFAVLLVTVSGVMWCDAVSRVDLEKNLEWMSAIFRGYPRPILRPQRFPGIVPLANCPECQCGIPRISNRVVGGEESPTQLYPWMTLLLYDGMGFCGGTLINDRYVLSAAHCTVVPKENVTMRLLEHDTTSDNENILNMKVAEIIAHPDFDNRTYDNDIALYKLQDSVDISEKRVVNRANKVIDDVTLRPVCLSPRARALDAGAAIVTGWGYLRDNGPGSPFLRQVNVPLITQEQCQKGYKTRKITENMMCAGYDDGGKDSCQGDSGGPMLVYNDETNTYQQPGIVSFGAGCAQPKRYGVYTKVSNYRDWIAENTIDACHCADSNV